MQFKFDGSRPPKLNIAWVNEMMRGAMSNDGLRLTAEPEEDQISEPQRLPALRGK